MDREPRGYSRPGRLIAKSCLSRYTMCVGYYFKDRQSISASSGADVEKALSIVSARYLAQNPPRPLVFKAFFAGGIQMDSDYRAGIDFDALLPGAAPGRSGVAWAKLWSDGETDLKFDLSCLSPVKIFCNGQAFASTIFMERDPAARHRISLKMKRGWNHVVVIAKKTIAGFGCVFGTWLGKQPYVFMMPTRELEQREGWLYAGPLLNEPRVLPGGRGDHSGLSWLPRMEWDGERAAQGRLRRILGRRPGAVAVGWAKAEFGRGVRRLKGRGTGPVTVFIDGKEVLTSATGGGFETAIDAPFGAHDVIVFSTCGEGDWDFDLSIDGAVFKNPCGIESDDQPWIFAGPFDAGAIPSAARLMDLRRPHPALGGYSYWRLDLPDTWVRPYNDSPLYGHWNYPLGVTLYGIIRAGQALGSGEMLSYVKSHVQFAVGMFDYASWDRKRFGGATTLLRNLAGMDSLDDCGSFGSLLLVAAAEIGIDGFRLIADHVADYISKKQARLPDGSFYRKNLMHAFHEETMWADDLYMSVPFLCRYYMLTGDRTCIDDAARQLLGFKSRLFIPELKLMSHVFDFRRGLATGVPWGRANGWTAFSLSELLSAIPADHPQRPDVLSMFREHASGLLPHQDPDGMWHQVITHRDSYPEASCTAMFAFAFARGVLRGWLEDPRPYRESALRAWEALTRHCIDRDGNLFGVCGGSEFSFSPDYYKNELGWRLNDTHGIGIVLLAGVEILELKKRSGGA
jgi:unsaturated rhamnogalacturonyl hydrolase